MCWFLRWLFGEDEEVDVRFCIHCAQRTVHEPMHTMMRSNLVFCQKCHNEVPKDPKESL